LIRPAALPSAASVARIARKIPGRKVNAKIKTKL
jgi:hypothetical protein